MPIYQLECDKCSHNWDAFFQMNAEKVAACPLCHNKGRRVFTKPNMSIDSAPNPNDLNTLTKKTSNMKGTLGDLWDFSKEMSNKRANANGGVDKIRQEAEQKWSKERRGKKFRETRKDKKQKIEIEINRTK
jgi:putative FmdB family regulatory protein